MSDFVDGMPNQRKKNAFSDLSVSVWTVPRRILKIAWSITSNKQVFVAKQVLGHIFQRNMT